LFAENSARTLHEYFVETNIGESMKKFLMIWVMISACLTGCNTPSATAKITAAPVSTATAATSAAPEMMIRIDFGYENPRPLGGIPLLLWLQPNVEAPNTNVTITMPADLVVLTGSKAWAGDLKANQALYLSLVVQIDTLSKPGFIQVDSVSYPKDAPKLEKTYKLYLRPTADGKVEFSQTPFSN
jgi:hypothetical protein